MSSSPLGRRTLLATPSTIFAADRGARIVLDGITCGEQGMRSETRNSETALTALILCRMLGSLPYSKVGAWVVPREFPSTGGKGL